MIRICQFRGVFNGETPFSVPAENPAPNEKGRTCFGYQRRKIHEGMVGDKGPEVRHGCKHTLRSGHFPTWTDQTPFGWGSKALPLQPFSLEAGLLGGISAKVFQKFCCRVSIWTAKCQRDFPHWRSLPTGKGSGKWRDSICGKHSSRARGNSGICIQGPWDSRQGSRKGCIERLSGPTTRWCLGANVSWQAENHRLFK